LFDWEKFQECHLFQELQGLRPISDKEDCWVWKDGLTTGFSICSAYNILRGHCGRECSSLFVSFWKIKVLPSALFTTWMVLGKRSLLRLTWLDEGLQLVVLPVVCAGRKRRQ